jgi:putative membrane protein
MLEELEMIHAKMFGKAAVLVASVVLSPMTAGAQSFGNPGGLSPDTPRLESGNPAPDHSNTQDKLFVREAALGGRAEVDLGKLAQSKASAEPVRSFAKRMVDDHGKSNEQLMKLARGVNTQLPKELDPEHKTVRTELDRASGANFDRAYLASQIQDHQRTANLLQYEISYGQNEGLKKYAADTLPAVLEHLEMAKLHFAQLTSPPSR